MNRISVPVIVGVCYTFLAFFTRLSWRPSAWSPTGLGLEVILAGAALLILGGHSIRAFHQPIHESVHFDCPDHSATDLASLHATRLSCGGVLFHRFGCFFLGWALTRRGILAGYPETGRRRTAPISGPRPR